MRKEFSTRVKLNEAVFEKETGHESSNFFAVVFGTLNRTKAKGKYGLITFCLILVSSASFGQTLSTVTGKTPLNIKTPKNWSKNKSMHGAAVYMAPQNCVIIDYKINDIHMNGPVQRSVDFVQGGSRFVSTQEMNDAFSSAFDLATKLNIKGDDYLDLTAKLDNKYSEYEKLQNTIEASHTSLQLKATVNGNGPFNGSSHYAGKTTIKIMCCDDYLCSKKKLDENLAGFVQEYADSLPKTNGEDDDSNTVTKNSMTPLWLYIAIILIVVVIIIIIIVIRRRQR